MEAYKPNPRQPHASKVAQIIGKPDAAWVRRLVTLCDQQPSDPYDTETIKEHYENIPIRGLPVQHPGVQNLMMTDIRNLQAFALFMQKTDIKFDLYSVTKEMEKQIGYEFDFMREADAMKRIRRFLYENNKKPLLGDEIAKRQTPVKVGAMAASKLDVFRPLLQVFISFLAILNILRSLTLAYGQMILKSGYFHADPHPGNILICRGSELENFIIYRELGIETITKCDNELKEMLKLAKTMFDTKLPDGVTMLQPFSEGSSIKKIAVQAFPEELFSVLRTVHLLRGLSVGLGINFSCADQWRPIAEEALYLAGRLRDGKEEMDM
ncbi:hypothetical protein Leryth_016655 [Lithospermum erythrorhizon]|nr:hypothetical protein Leryth_016655 [Lithospermum erythrorhizon]